MAENAYTLTTEGQKDYSVGDNNWDDSMQPALSARTGASAPGFDAFLAAGGLLVPTFDGINTIEQVYFSVQLPHSYKEGTNIIPHIHWTPTTADAGNVVWQMEYSWGTIGSAFPAAATIETAAAAAGGTAWVHKMTDFAELNGNGKTVSSIIIGRAFRAWNHASDTYEHDVSFVGLDFHFKKDTAGSNTASAK